MNSSYDHNFDTENWFIHNSYIGDILIEIGDVLIEIGDVLIEIGDVLTGIGDVLIEIGDVLIEIGVLQNNGNVSDTGNVTR